MKIKSVVDVITNSSTEVFIMKLSDYNEMKAEIGELEPKISKFNIFETINDVLDYSERYSRPDFGLIPGKYELSDRTRKILKDFGHSEEEIDNYINKKQKEKRELLKGNEKYKNLVGTAALASDHCGGLGRNSLVDKWMEEHGKTYIRREYD